MKKYGLLKYSKTNNLGDEVQSIAARRFLPKVEVLVDRDKISKYNGPPIKMILNGWFMNEPENWPPSQQIMPLLISFHIDPRCYKELLSKKSLDYFKKFEPIGCRDYVTKELLEMNGVRAYFSGCLTLTLNKKGVKKNNKIILADVDEKVKKKIPSEYMGDVLELTHFNDSSTIVLLKKIMYSSKLIRNMSNNKKIKKLKRKIFTEKKESSIKFKEANERLEIYEGAKAVVTTRIHVALPCLAMGTPVVFIVNDKKDPRYKGLLELFNSLSYEDVLKDGLSLEKIKPNPEKYLKLREKLEKEVQKFIEDN